MPSQSRRVLWAELQSDEVARKAALKGEHPDVPGRHSIRNPRDDNADGARNFIAIITIVDVPTHPFDGTAKQHILAWG